MHPSNHYGALNQFTGNRNDGHNSHSYIKEKTGIGLAARSHHECQDFSHTERDSQHQLSQARDFSHHESYIRQSHPTTMIHSADDYHAEHYQYDNNKRIYSQYRGQRIPRIMSDPHFRDYQDRQPLTRYLDQPPQQYGVDPHQEIQRKGSFNTTGRGNVSAVQSATIQQTPVSSPGPRREQPPQSPKQMDHTLNQTVDVKQDSAPHSRPRSDDTNDGKYLQSSDPNSARQLNNNSEKRLPPKKREERLSKSSIGGEEKKESNESQEKELVNGALLALVSLAKRPAPPPSCAQRSSRRSSSSSLTSIRESEIQTPPPQAETHVSNTITPTSSAATMQAFMAQQPTLSLSNSMFTKDYHSSVSDDSNPRNDRGVPPRRRQSATLSERSTEYNNPSHVLPPKHPLTLPEVSHDLKRGIPPPPFPLPSRSNIPVPRLDRDRLESTTPGYTLTMRKDVDSHFDRDGTYNAHPQQYVTTDESCVHEGRRMSVHGARPRFYSTPIEYTRQGYHEYERLSDYPPPSLSHERPHPRHYGLEARGSFDDGRMGGVVGQRNRVASRDDCEERGHQYHIARTHFPDEAYYSPSPHYLPLHKRQPNGSMYHPTSQPMSRRGHFVHHAPPTNRLHSQEVRIQFECPDSRGSRKECPSGPLSCVSSFEDYPPSPYQIPAYHNRLPEGHPQGQMGVKKTILRRKCAWKNYPELEKFLIENREDYLRHSAKNYTIEQKQYNNRLTERLLEVAAKHNYVFDPNDFNFVAVRDRIRCYYKSYVQTNKKRGVAVGYDATGAKKQKIEETSEKNDVEEKEKAPNNVRTEESKIVHDKKPEEK